MKRIASLLAVAGMLALPGAATADEEVAMTKGEKKLAKLLEGRVAGEPQSCISTGRSDNLRIIDETALVYGRGNTVWVNVPRRPESLDQNDTLVIKRQSWQLCKQDIVYTVDTPGFFFTGTVFLGDFVPYRKVES